MAEVLAAISVWVLYEAVLQFMSSRIMEAPVMLMVAWMGLVGNILVMLLLRPHAANSINMKSAFARIIYGAISSLAVTVTESIALYTGITTVDLLVASLIAGFVSRSAYSIVRTSTHIILEGATSELDMNHVITEVKQLDGVVDVDDLCIWTICKE